MILRSIISIRKREKNSSLLPRLLEIRSEKLKDAAGASNFNAIPADQTFGEYQMGVHHYKDDDLRVEVAGRGGLRVERAHNTCD